MKNLFNILFALIVMFFVSITSAQGMTNDHSASVSFETKGFASDFLQSDYIVVEDFLKKIGIKCCKSGVQYIAREQKYYNFESAMKRSSTKKVLFFRVPIKKKTKKK